MTGICFHWEPPASIADNAKASKKLLLHWTHTAKCFGVKDVYCIGDTGSYMGDMQINWHNIGSLDELPKTKKVYVEQGGESLVTFEHPEDCIYVFGSDYNGLPKADLSIDADLGLYAEQACAIILYDRRVKRGGN